MKLTLRHLLLCYLGLVAPALAMASIEISNEKPEVGEALTLTFSVPVDTLTVTYRPNSSVSRTEFLVNNPPATTMQWQSEEPGLVALSYQDKSGDSPQSVNRNLSVRFRGVSGSGLAVMILAGIMLFGGAANAFRILFQEQDEGRAEVFDPEEVPDT